jgi:hypothetical protein
VRGVGERRIGRNDVLLGAIRTAGGAPGPISRAAAEMNAALYDAESSYRLRWHTMTSDPYLKAVDYAAWAEGPGEEERIIGRTAYNILLKIFPGQTTYLDNKFKERFGTSPTDFDLAAHQLPRPAGPEVRPGQPGGHRRMGQGQAVGAHLGFPVPAVDARAVRLVRGSAREPRLRRAGAAGA